MLQDQCRREMAAGRVFRYVREAPITFRPTYKFDKHVADPYGYDSSEKHRVPAWTDRIFFRGSAFIKNADVRLQQHAFQDPWSVSEVTSYVASGLRCSNTVDW